MPILDNPQHENFALLVALGHKPSKAYVEVGYSAHGARVSAHRLLTNSDVSMRVLEVRTQISNRVIDGTVALKVADRNARLAEWQERWDEVRDALDGILIERGAEMENVPGGSTGFLIRIRKGPQPDQCEYRIDLGVLRLISMLLDIGEQVSRELGQWGQEYQPEEEEEPKIDCSKLTNEEVETMDRLFQKATGRKSPRIDKVRR